MFINVLLLRMFNLWKCIFKKMKSNKTFQRSHQTSDSIINIQCHTSQDKINTIQFLSIRQMSTVAAQMLEISRSEGTRRLQGDLY